MISSVSKIFYGLLVLMHLSALQASRQIAHTPLVFFKDYSQARALVPLVTCPTGAVAFCNLCILSNVIAGGTITALDGFIPAGFLGTTGATGLAGSTGISSTGPIGAQGSTGANGIPGVTGATGISVIGVPGMLGSPGAPGLSITGITGMIGNTGASGHPGSTGRTGTNGLNVTGTNGATGASGTAGISITGVTGLIGSQGTTGQGITGATGLQGAVGATGAMGASVAGPQGITGTLSNGPGIITDTTPSTGFCATATTGVTGFSHATGALVIAGGVAVGNNLNVQGYSNTCTDYKKNNVTLLNAYAPDLSSPVSTSRSLSIGFNGGNVYGATPTLNTFIGNFAGHYAAAQKQNTFCGDACAAKSTKGKGDANVGVGHKTLYTIATNKNSCLGAYILIRDYYSPSMTAVGANAFFVTRGEYSTGFGFDVGKNIVTGYQNALIGPKAMYNNILNGNHNTAIGYRALYTNEVGNFNIGVGSNSAYRVYNSYGITLGNTGSLPADTTIIGTNGLQDLCFIAGINGTYVGSSNPVSINAKGQLGTSSSSKKFKEGIEIMPDQTEKIMKLRPVNFHYKSDVNQALQYGLIAEEVEALYPEIVTRNNEGEIYSINYVHLIPILLAQIQTLQKENDLEKACIDQNTLLQAEHAKITEQQAEIQNKQAALLQEQMQEIAQCMILLQELQEATNSAAL